MLISNPCCMLLSASTQQPSEPQFCCISLVVIPWCLPAGTGYGSHNTGNTAENVKSYVPGTDANRESRYEQGRDTGRNTGSGYGGNQGYGSNQGYGEGSKTCCRLPDLAMACNLHLECLLVMKQLLLNASFPMCQLSACVQCFCIAMCSTQMRQGCQAHGMLWH